MRSASAMNAGTNSERRIPIFVAIVLVTFSAAVPLATTPSAARADDYAMEAESPLRLSGLLDTRIVHGSRDLG